MENIKGPTNVPQGLPNLRERIMAVAAELPQIDRPDSLGSEKERLLKVEWMGLNLRALSSGRGIQLLRHRLDNIKLTGAQLAEIDMSGSSLTRAKCVGVRFSHGRLSEVDFTEADLQEMWAWQAVFDRARFQQADLRKADLKRSSLARCDLRCADLRGADLSGVNLQDADLRNIRFNAGTNWQGANLQGTCLESTKLPQQGNFFGSIRLLELKLTARAALKGSLRAIKRLLG